MDRQKAELLMRARILNVFTQLGMPDSYRVSSG